MPRQLRDDDADALVARAPDHAVAGDQCRQVGPQVAAEHLPAVFALQCLDLDLYAEMRDDQPGLFRAQVSALQLLEGTASRRAARAARSSWIFSMRQLCRRLSWRLAMGWGCLGVLVGESSMPNPAGCGLYGASVGG